MTGSGSFVTWPLNAHVRVCAVRRPGRKADLPDARRSHEYVMRVRELFARSINGLNIFFSFLVSVLSVPPVVFILICLGLY